MQLQNLSGKVFVSHCFFKNFPCFRFYDVGKENNPIGKLPDLSEKASGSASMIQAYVDFVLEQTTFASMADEEIAKLGKKHGWKANFGELDTHLNLAKDHAVSWNIDVISIILFDTFCNSNRLCDWS